jgi:hypothetical protein
MRVDQAVDKLAFMIEAIERDILDGKRRFVFVRFNGHNLHAHLDRHSPEPGRFVVWRVDGAGPKTFGEIIVACVKPFDPVSRRSDDPFWGNTQ